ncbi:MAG TPA: hypothetical protein VFP55_05320 [Solirubrobacteraceae bacterium]|nr:hypothetical protein [Solirubrobacteraceae bacterium]
MRHACIDIGSNTTRLLVADWDGGQLREVRQERSFTRIGHDVAHGGRISAPKVAEVGEVVAGQFDQARALGAELVRCVATAAVRRAGNRADLVSWIGKRCPGLKVEILSEQEEARLAFLGASLTLHDPPRDLIGLVDVGGGSSELVVGEPDGTVRWWRSLPFGSGDLTAGFIRADPPAPIELAAIRARVRGALDGVMPPRPARVMAVGGSATSLLAMTSGQVLDPAALDRALDLLRGRPAAQVARDTGLDPERVKLLPAGLLILREAAARFAQPLVIGAGGLREGVLLAAAGGG